MIYEFLSLTFGTGEDNFLVILNWLLVYFLFPVIAACIVCYFIKSGKKKRVIGFIFALWLAAVIQADVVAFIHDNPIIIYDEAKMSKSVAEEVVRRVEERSSYNEDVFVTVGYDISYRDGYYIVQYMTFPNDIWGKIDRQSRVPVENVYGW